MRVYVLRRLVQIVPTVLMITFVVFLMMQSIPGDPVVALLGDAYTEEDAERMRQAYGLDRPVVVQYLIWLGKLARPDAIGRLVFAADPGYARATISIRQPVIDPASGVLRIEEQTYSYDR